MVETVELTTQDRRQRACIYFGNAVQFRWNVVPSLHARTWARDVFFAPSSKVFARMDGRRIRAVVGVADLAHVKTQDADRLAAEFPGKRVLYMQGLAVGYRHESRKHARELHHAVREYAKAEGYRVVVTEAFKPERDLTRYSHHWIRMQGLGWRELFPSSRASEYGPIHWLRLI